MKTIKILKLTLGLLVGGQFANAETTKTPFHNADVVVFDAICSPSSPTMGYLTVSLQMSARLYFARGEFYSFSEISGARDGKDRQLIPLTDCLETETALNEQAGRKISLNGDYTKQAYVTLEKIYGTCREHPLAGGGSYPCVKGTRQVTRYKYTTVLNVGSFFILNKSY